MDSIAGCSVGKCDFIVFFIGCKGSIKKVGIFFLVCRSGFGVASKCCKNSGVKMYEF